ncbi:DNA polymerase III subunit beta [[Clostridium] colinum]|uniref:DNA polymerase III subunit beta n=1 Tax=[Clostridium] colinum TaxID=36835 RepID=UPI0020243E4E|nr:DNA polymerase III subunit beta [[Clostridium] colinum]
MHIKCKKDILLININIVLKSVASRTTLPILECILLKADKEGFKLISNDLELGIKTANIEADIIEKGIVALEARMFYDIIKSMPDGDISINVDEKNVTIIKSGKTEFKILGQNGEEFPTLNTVEKEEKYSISASTLKNMIKQTKFSVSSDESKPVLTGELIEIKEGYLNIVAIDGFRVSFRRTQISKDFKNAEVVVPAKALNEIIKILSDKEDSMVNLYFNENYILFELDSCIIVSRLLDGEFLKYEQIFTEDYNTKIEVDRISLLNSLERASLISKDNKKTPVKLEIKTNENLVITSNTEFGTSYEEVFIDIEGEGLSIAFNPRYLIEALKAIDDEKVIIQFITSLSPCIIKGVDNNDYKYLILPLKINE